MNPTGADVDSRRVPGFTDISERQPSSINSNIKAKEVTLSALNVPSVIDSPTAKKLKYEDATEL
jgi:hypothetical protein